MKSKFKYIFVVFLCTFGIANASSEKQYQLSKDKTYEAVMTVLAKLGMPIESSNPIGGHVKSSTAYRRGLFMTLEVTNVYVEPSTGSLTTVRIERLKGRAGGKPKPADDDNAYNQFFNELDKVVSK